MDSIAKSVLPNMSFMFRNDIDLMDETLREGAERASIPPTMEQKCELAISITKCGIKTIVVGMFPDVPHNVALLTELVRLQRLGEIPSDVRFMVISHVGITFRDTVALLERRGLDIPSVWVIVIHSVSDLQIEHLFHTVLTKDQCETLDKTQWSLLSEHARREKNLNWLKNFLPSVDLYKGGGIMFGLLDLFRADIRHVENVISLLIEQGIRQVRLVDTAGTCLPEQIQTVVSHLIEKYSFIDFYGHFHDDFGMATANAIRGLSFGLKGVDVSVGGFANRAGHPPMAEITVALRQLYGIELKGFDYTGLYELSRQLERAYGLMECPTQALTGIVTHSVQSGIRTELLDQAPQIFDVVSPAIIGGAITRMFGVRSGKDGLLRFIRNNAEALRVKNISELGDVIDELYDALDAEWARRSESVSQRMRASLNSYQSALKSSFFTEGDMIEWLSENLKNVTRESV